jgi:hypothetical protein
MRYRVDDPEIGEATVHIKKVEDNSNYAGGKRIYWNLYHENSTDDYAQSLDSVVEYLLSAKARRHPGSGA